ncbi:Polyamine aminopropyltransferase [Pandoraea iniqua]|uniref:Polyamine aminopropyltransferase n=1 Tax=Pandoraea iniqua TaxID=2508288 RepID=A0A5E4YW26_9BURK|nr:hypothetical protein [Pandoraea iniqua]VVE52702.1 Polyamine aminopropyltransferase [Pandoraea iniqua]
MPVISDVTADDSDAALKPFSAPLGPWATYALAGRTVATAVSPYQHIEIVDLPAFGPLGRAYRLDGRFMASLADAHICHECMVHPLLLAHGDAKRVLVIGGGDGGSAREALRHASVSEVVIAELDAQVPATILRHMPSLAGGAFDDRRTTLVIGDARDYADAARSHGDRFDAVIFDLTEADGAAAPLHDAAFFAKVRSLLTPRGGIAVQLGAPWFEPAQVQRVLAALRSVFVHVQPMTAYVPLYGSLWALAIASDALDVRGTDTNALQAAAQRVSPDQLRSLRHYAASRHAALFDIPPDLIDTLDAPDAPIGTR